MYGLKIIIFIMSLYVSSKMMKLSNIRKTVTYVKTVKGRFDLIFSFIYQIRSDQSFIHSSSSYTIMDFIE